MRKNLEAYKQYQAEYYQRNKERLNEYKRKYQKEVVRKNAKHFAVAIDKEIMLKLENKLLKDGITKKDFLLKAINEYLNK